MTSIDPDSLIKKRKPSLKEQDLKDQEFITNLM